MKAIPLHAGNPGPLTGDGNWTYLIEGPRPVLIDAGVGTPSHLDAIDAAAGDRQLHLVVTHAHSDHIAGAPAIRERRPRRLLSKMPWPIRDRDLAWTPLADGDYRTTGYGDLASDSYPRSRPRSHLPLARRIANDVCGRHAGAGNDRGHSRFTWRQRGGIPAAHSTACCALDPARALPAHGPLIDDPQGLIHHTSSTALRARRRSWRRCEPALSTVDEFLARIYPGLQPALEGFARESILAHLIKLESDGRIAA